MRRFELAKTLCFGELLVLCGLATQRSHVGGLMMGGLERLEEACRVWLWEGDGYIDGWVFVLFVGRQEELTAYIERLGYIEVI